MLLFLPERLQRACADVACGNMRFQSGSCSDALIGSLHRPAPSVGRTAVTPSTRPPAVTSMPVLAQLRAGDVHVCAAALGVQS